MNRISASKWSVHLIGCKNYTHSTRKTQKASFVTTSSNDPSKLDGEDVGKLYSVPQQEFNALGYHKLHLPIAFRKQILTLREFVWLYRKQTHEAFECIRAIEPGQMAPRLVIWGKYGTGKTITLYQLVHLALTQGYVILSVPDAMVWLRDNHNEVQVSTYKQGRLNSPIWATNILLTFKHQNSRIWNKLSELKTIKKYMWSQVEWTEEGKPVTEIVEKGLTAQFLATDCVGALGKELRIHASEGRIKLLVALDKANGLYGKTVIKRPDRTIATSNELALTVHMRKFLLPIWSNGICAMVADKAEISDCRDTLSVPVNEPRALFGEEGFEQIEPFVSLKTSLYSPEELGVMLDYYLEKNWVHLEEGEKAKEAMKQVIYLSAFNPAYFERICAMSWDLTRNIQTTTKQCSNSL